MQISEVVVMYLGTEEIERPRVPPCISAVEGIQSIYSFFLLNSGVVAARPWSCWCDACSRVRRDAAGGLHGAHFNGNRLVVPDCKRQNLTVWRQKPPMTSTTAKGIANAREFQKDLVAKLLQKAKPGFFGAVQADELWSESERRHLRSGHHWVFQFGDAGDGSCVKKRFELAPRSWTEYEGTRYYNGEAALVIKRWFHRADDDASGCTFIEWDSAKATAPGAPPAALLLNSSKLRGVFTATHFKALMPPALEGAGRVKRSKRGAAVREVEGVGEVRQLLCPNKDSEIRHACVQAGSVLA
jgi:hypothetical protein